MARWFGGTMVLVAVGSVVWSRLVVDPECTEGPCSQHVPLVLGFGIEVLIAVLWVVTAIVVSVREGRDGSG
ncbi:MAG TPA: hypothetical protein VG106_07735 [Vicinamibacterales bacterium]|nr:hypothetical protein [Vicinamibacterales bacterium]